MKSDVLLHLNKFYKFVDLLNYDRSKYEVLNEQRDEQVQLN